MDGSALAGRPAASGSAAADVGDVEMVDVLTITAAGGGGNGGAGAVAAGGGSYVAGGGNIYAAAAAVEAAGGEPSAVLSGPLEELWVSEVVVADKLVICQPVRGNGAVGPAVEENGAAARDRNLRRAYLQELLHAAEAELEGGEVLGLMEQMAVPGMLQGQQMGEGLEQGGGVGEGEGGREKWEVGLVGMYDGMWVCDGGQGWGQAGSSSGWGLVDAYGEGVSADLVMHQSLAAAAW